MAFQSSITEIGVALGHGEKSPGLAALSSLGSILLRRVKRLSAFGGGEGLVFAERVIDGVGVGKGVHQVRGEEDDVGALLHALVVLTADALGEVEVRALAEGIEFGRLFRHIIS